MKLTTKTDPITGLDFSALLGNNGDIRIDTPFNGVIEARYNAKEHTYAFDAKLFDHEPKMSLSEVVDSLGVTKARVSKLCANGTLKSVKMGNALLIDAQSVQKYKESRKCNRS